MNKKIIYGIIIAIFFTGGIIGYRYYQKIFGKNILKNGVIYIRSKDDLVAVKKQLNHFLKHPEYFIWLAKKKKFVKPKGGKYILKKGMSTNELINLLRSNKVPVNVSFNNEDTLERLAGKISYQIEADSISLLKMMKDSIFLTKHNFTEKSALGMYIPNTYEFYWNTSANSFRDKMLEEYNIFWTKKRIEKAKNINLTPKEVLTLASIVQKETTKKSERPMVARLYLNRLENGWPLQADPTIIFALKNKMGINYKVERVLSKDLKIKSPYNTYKNKGLPPSLIGMPDISAIEAVLNPSVHNYFYMCASIDKIGFHEFSSSFKQHQRNAKKYREWINKKGIYR